MLTFDADTRLLTSRTQTWARSAGVSMPEGLRIQGGRLKEDLWKGGQPKNLSASKKAAEKSVRGIFAPLPTRIFRDSRADGKLRWLYAGKGNGRFLVGVDHADYKPGLSIQAMRRLRSDSKGALRGNRYIKLGKRGKENPFHVMKLNRIATQRTRVTAFVKDVQGRFGLQKAAWAVDIEKFGGKRPPQWIAKHIGNGAKGANVVNLRGDKPFIRIISRARGVESAASKAHVRRCVKRRSAAMLKDMKFYLNGTKKKAGLN